MNNKEIARSFRLLADLMELHNENPFKIRSYANAYISLRKIDRSLMDMEESEIASIKGIGSSVAKKIRELAEKGEIDALRKFQDVTPKGIQQILSIKGIGPKKVKQIWKELGAESPGELLYACQENRLVDLKGFGYKTQEDYKAKIEYFLDSQEKSLYASIEDDAFALISLINQQFPDLRCALVGELARKCPIITKSELIIESSLDVKKLGQLEAIEIEVVHQNQVEVRLFGKSKFYLHLAGAEQFEIERFKKTADETILADWMEKFDFPKSATSQEEIFKVASINVIPPEIMEGEEVLSRILEEGIPNLIDDADVKGILHNHSTYSDGLHSLKEMSEYVKEEGYEYFGICDHSQSAFYANGMKPDRVYDQLQEIDMLNAQLMPFKVFKGIESDILNDGSLDYEDEILGMFDFIVASVHSNLRMDKAKATQRLISAVENPYTRILGHPTGRLLLSREGYPIDHMKVIDACAENGVVIELNANPLRLDIDFTWIPYALEKGVMISINPDAHSKGGVGVTRFGVMAARKGWLTKEMCLNALGLLEFQKWVDRA
jgi:DNA polymerase (family 10)